MFISRQLIGINSGDQRRLAVRFLNTTVPIGDDDRIDAVIKELPITLVSGLQALEELRMADGGTCQAANSGEHHQGIRIECTFLGIEGFQNAHDLSARSNWGAGN